MCELSAKPLGRLDYRFKVALNERSSSVWGDFLDKWWRQGEQTNKGSPSQVLCGAIQSAQHGNGLLVGHFLLYLRYLSELFSETFDLTFEVVVVEIFNSLRKIPHQHDGKVRWDRTVPFLW